MSHGLFLEPGMPGHMAAAAKENDRQNNLTEGQQENSAEADESYLLDHGLTFVSHGFPLHPGHCDTESLDLFPVVLGLRRQGIHPSAFLHIFSRSQLQSDRSSIVLMSVRYGITSMRCRGGNIPLTMWKSLSWT